MAFNIDQRLMADCSVVLQQPDTTFLLHHNADVLWFILVPHTEVSEFYQLSDKQQHNLCAQINRISKLIDKYFECDKINVATIGNVVSQMHIHIVGRCINDPYWPGVVWGQPMQRQHDADFIHRVTELVQKN